MHRWITAHPRLMLLAGCLAALSSGLVLAIRFRVDPDVSSLFPKDDPTLALTRSLQGDARPGRSLFLILRGAGDLDGAAGALAERLRASPRVERVVATLEEWSGGRAERMREAPAHYLPEEALAALERRLAGPERRERLADLERRIAIDPLAGRQVALADPLDLRWLLSDGLAASRFPAPLAPGARHLVFASPSVALLRVVGRRESFDTAFSQALLDDVRARAGPGLDLQMAGGYVSSAFNASRMRRDLQVQAVLSTALVVGFLWVFTGSFVLAHVLLLPVALALACTLALGALVVGPLTPLAVGVIAVMIGMGIDYPIHLLAHYREQRRTRDPRPAMEAALAALGRPFAGAVATTVAPLLLLLASGFPGFRQFGGLLGAGIGISVLLSLTFLVPLVLAADRFLGRQSQGPWAVRLACGILGSAARRPVAAAIGLVALAAWGLTASRGVAVDLDFRNVMAKGDPGVAALERLEGELGFALTPVVAHVEDPLAGRRLEGEASVSGAHDLVPAAPSRVERFRAATRGWKEGALSDLRSLGFDPAPFRPALDDLEARLARTAPDPASVPSLRHEGRWVLTILPRRPLWDAGERAAFDARVRAALGPSVPLYSAYHLPDYSAGILKRDLARVGGWSLAAIALMAMLATGSPGRGLLALVPMLAGVGVTLGACRLLGIPLNFFNFEALPILMGTGIDHGIYYVTHRRRHPGQAPAEAVRETGPGMWGTMAATLLGFGAVAFSSAPGLAAMGILVAAGMSAAFAATLLLLPSLSYARFGMRIE
jgi:hypothetical protein